MSVFTLFCFSLAPSLAGCFASFVVLKRQQQPIGDALTKSSYFCTFGSVCGIEKGGARTSKQGKHPLACGENDDKHYGLA